MGGASPGLHIRIVGIVGIIDCGLACARDTRPAGTTFEGVVPWRPDLRTRRRSLADDLICPSIDTDGRGITTGCPPQELPHTSQGVAHGYTARRVVASSHRSDPARSRPPDRHRRLNRQPPGDQTLTPERRDRTSCAMRSATEIGGSCSQNRSTSHPRVSSSAVVSRSRDWFRPIFVLQYSTFVAGIEKCSGQPCQ